MNTQLVILTTKEAWPALLRDGYHARQGGRLEEWPTLDQQNLTGIVVYWDMECCQAEGLKFYKGPHGLLCEGFGVDGLIPPMLFAAAEDLDEGIWLFGQAKVNRRLPPQESQPLFQFQHERPREERAIQGVEGHLPPLTILDRPWEEHYITSQH